MKRVLLNALSAVIMNSRIYALIKQDERLNLLVLDKDLKVTDEIWNIKGRLGFILKVEGGKALVSIDDKLYLVEDGEAEAVLTTDTPGNTFWHLAEADKVLFVHEYGRPPTSIYMSRDLISWERVITNLDIDRSSKHFHDIAYDPYRKWLISTLGDGCLTRVAVSEDLGSSWRPLYKGPWQFVPIVVSKDKLMFGMDSGIVRGGIGVFDPINHKWSFVFLRWREQDTRFMQMCSLKLLNNGLYIAGLGTPQAVVVSKDIKTWYLVHAEGFDEQFNMHMGISEGEEFIVCSTGKSLLSLRKDEFNSLRLTNKPVIVKYGAYIERLIGLGFYLKHIVCNLHRDYKEAKAQAWVLRKASGVKSKLFERR